MLLLTEPTTSGSRRVAAGLKTEDIAENSIGSPAAVPVPYQVIDQQGSSMLFYSYYAIVMKLMTNMSFQVLDVSRVNSKLIIKSLDIFLLCFCRR